jgi:hypothetical protein
MSGLNCSRQGSSTMPWILRFSCSFVGCIFERGCTNSAPMVSGEPTRACEHGRTFGRSQCAGFDSAICPAGKTSHSSNRDELGTRGQRISRDAPYSTSVRLFGQGDPPATHPSLDAHPAILTKSAAANSSEATRGARFAYASIWLQLK